MTEYEFYHSTMKYIQARVEAFQQAQKEQWKQLEYHAWLTGIFTRSAVWGKKYPDCPVKDEMQELVDIAKTRELTDDERERYAELFMERMEELERRHARSKATGGKPQ